MRRGVRGDWNTPQLHATGSRRPTVVLPGRTLVPSGSLPPAPRATHTHTLVPACPPRSDRPACENVEGGPRPQDAHYPLIGALVHCNLRLGPGALLRLGHFVDQAMRRWAARTGRYEVLQQGPLAGGAADATHLALPAPPPAEQLEGIRRRHAGVGSAAGDAVKQAARRKE